MIRANFLIGVYRDAKRRLLELRSATVQFIGDYITQRMQGPEAWVDHSI